MKLRNIFNKDYLIMLICIVLGFIAGFTVMVVCYVYDLFILGVNICIFIAPVVAGFVETFVSKLITGRSSGAFSAIALFFLTNVYGWVFPSTPLKFNIFTVGGFFLMLQAAFPLVINYLLIGLYLTFVYTLGLIGAKIGSLIHRRNVEILKKVDDIEDISDLGVVIFNNAPEVPIKEYHGLIFSEEVVEFNEKDSIEKIQYMSTKSEERTVLKHRDYDRTKKFVLHNLQKEAIERKANAIIDVEFEYTNYNQHMPPDVLIAVYGTAVSIDEKYLK